MAGWPGPKKILIFRIGQLGDMVVSLPALWATRRHWPDARLTLLCDVQVGRNYVLGSEVFGPTGLFERIEHYVVPAKRRPFLSGLTDRLALLMRLRMRRYDALVYLAPSIREPEQVKRDVAFFKAAGIRRIYGATHFPPVPIKRPGQPFEVGLSEADLLLARLAADGIPVPRNGTGVLDLVLGEAEAAEVAQWLTTIGSDGARRWIGIGPGSKMPAKRWPLDRFEAVVATLIARHDVWPVVFGGPEEQTAGHDLLARWGRGYNAAGTLSVRASCMALTRCALYLGNDTGTMHLAAAADVPCIALFSARDWPGAWYPYGVAQRVFRTALECEGCYLVECVDRRNECLTRITVDDVVAGCEDLLRSQEIISDRRTHSA
jgi:ADP-heptose:LPS heptosyltransferase